MTVNGAAPLQILRAEDVASSGLAKLGVFGANGVGKTRLLSTVPPSIPTLVVSADQENVDLLRGLGHVRVIKVNQWDELQGILSYLGKTQHPFKHVAFDTWTRMQALAVNRVVNYSPRSIDEAMQFVTRVPTTPKGYDAWQNVGALAAEWMGYFLQLPMHVTFIMQQMGRKEDRNDPDENARIVPALTPWALRRALEALKMIGYLYVEDASQAGTVAADPLNLAAGTTNPYAINPNTQEVRKMLIGQHPLYATKGPTHKLGYLIEDPTWDKLAVGWE